MRLTIESHPQCSSPGIRKTQPPRLWTMTECRSLLHIGKRLVKIDGECFWCPWATTRWFGVPRSVSLLLSFKFPHIPCVPCAFYEQYSRIVASLARLLSYFLSGCPYATDRLYHSSKAPLYIYIYIDTCQRLIRALDRDSPLAPASMVIILPRQFLGEKVPPYPHVINPRLGQLAWAHSNKGCANNHITRSVITPAAYLRCAVGSLHYHPQLPLIDEISLMSVYTLPSFCRDDTQFRGFAKVTFLRH